MHTQAHGFRKKAEMALARAKKTAKKGEKPPSRLSKATISVCPEYTELQKLLLTTVAPAFDEATREFPKNIMDTIKVEPKLDADLKLKKKGKIMPFFGMVRSNASLKGKEV